MITPNQSLLQYNLRDELQKLVVADLLGPADGPEEIVDELEVRGRYLVGLLAPKGQSALPDDSLAERDLAGEYDEDPLMATADGEEDGFEGQVTPAAFNLLPSSLGLTFSLASETETLRITARWGQYKRVRLQEDRFKKEDGSYRSVWQRYPHEGQIVIPLTEGRFAPWSPDPQMPDVYVQGLVRRRDHRWTVTLFLINGQQEGAPKDEFWLFQPELVVDAPDGSAIFHRRLQRAPIEEPEQEAMTMLYRRQVEFAVGHGVAVHAEPQRHRPDCAVRLTTVVVPTYDVPLSTPPTVPEIPALSNLTLNMKTLAAVEDGRIAEHLAGLPDAYRQWIEALKRRVEAEKSSRQDAKTQREEENLSGSAALRESDLLPHLAAAQAAIDNCEKTLARIQAGIDLLSRNAHAAQAFAFANRAMYMQRVHTHVAAAVRRGETPNHKEIEDDPANYTWRTFQLAFILLNLAGLADPTHPERSQVADLLWFPTGGGKTEAYLGVAAFAMSIRRLQGEVGGRSGHAGITVLMRYTLRLLTLQQFQRATALICACEVIRRRNPEIWGGEPFRIGLWVGRNTTPNRTVDADEAVKRIKQGGFGGGQGTPHQLTNCPWCGSPINAGQHIDVDVNGQGRTILYCGDPLGQCPFTPRQAKGEGIPALVVDEEIYRRLPSLLIATVDKFAQMPWNGRTAMLFGLVDGYCERHGFRSPEIEDSNSHPANRALGLPAARTLPMGPLRPPDLIIQDELHLISGPLGTLVGLYETAVDELMSWEVDGQRVRPKIIASTATIRQAGEQVHHLFDREVKIFPPTASTSKTTSSHASASPTRKRRAAATWASARRASVTKPYLSAPTPRSWPQPRSFTLNTVRPPIRG